MRFLVTYADEFEAATFEQAYDELLLYLRVCVLADDVTAFGFERVEPVPDDRTARLKLLETVGSIRDFCYWVETSLAKDVCSEEDLRDAAANLRRLRDEVRKLPAAQSAEERREDSFRRAREEFVTLLRRENAESVYKQSLAADWTKRGFKDPGVQARWSGFLEGWTAAEKI